MILKYTILLLSAVITSTLLRKRWRTVKRLQLTNADKKLVLFRLSSNIPELN